MPKIATFRELQSFSANVDQAMLLKQAAAPLGKTVFLSHSHEDLDLLPGVIKVLEGHGGRVYIDQVDTRLPQKTNRETAEILRSTISGCTRFVAFVTPKSKDSRWIPWELGLADGKKGAGPVAIFPSAERAEESAWTEQEYLGLYYRIVWGTITGNEKPGWMVYNHGKNEAIWLQAWLAGATL